jgi:PAS domain S-box-containing protein
MSAGLLVLELLLLAAAALGLHAVSRRYGLVPLLVYLAGLVAILHAMGAAPVFVEPWPGVRVASADATVVPTIFLVLLVLFDADGAAVARTALAGVVGVSFVAFTVHAARLGYIQLGGATEVTAAVAGPNLRFTAASIVAFLAGMLALVVAYQTARNHARFLPMEAVRTVALVAAAVADTAVFRGLGLPPSVALAGLSSALAVKGAAALLLAPAAAWYLARVAPRLQAYVGPEDRGAFDLLFGRYGRQEIELRTTRGEMRRTEERLRETDARFRHTFELAAVGIVHTTPDGTILLANPAAASFLGYRTGELEQRKLSSLMPDDAGGEAPGDGKGPFLPSGEHRFLRKDGTAVWGLARTTDVRAEAVRPSYHIVVIEDITARNAAEERLRQVERLEAIGRLTGGVAHDFNNLLAVIIGDTEEAMARAASGEDAAEALAPVIRAARKGAKLTQQLLAYSGQQVLQPRSLDCGVVLREASDLLKLAVGGGIDVVVDCEPGLRVVVDRTHLESALLSLAANAQDAMPHGGQLTVRAFHERGPAPVGPDGDVSPTSPSVTIEVTDTGRGMTPDVAARAFEPFFTTKEVGQGSGLGLSMVYGFAKQSGGYADIESEPGRGTTVRMRLPAAGPKTSGPAGAPADGREAGEAVLMVEDDPEVGRVLSHALEQLGYRVIAAGDATEALREMARARPSLVIADVVLPGGRSGTDLAVHIHRDHPGVPVLFVSGYSREILQARYHLPAGADLLTKPFGREELERMVRTKLHPKDRC